MAPIYMVAQLVCITLTYGLINVQTNSAIRWFGHVGRMTIDRIPHNALHARFDGKRNKGGPTLRRIDNVKDAIESIGMASSGAMDLTKDRGQWRSFIRTHRRQMAGVRN